MVRIGLIVLTGLAVAAQGAEIRIDGRDLVVNGQAEIPLGLFGVHAVGITPERVEDMGITASRHIHFHPGTGVTALDREGNVRPPFDRLAVVIDCMGDRYAHATVLDNPNYEEFFRRIGRAYAERCLEAGYRGFVEFWNEPYLNWAERSRGSARNNYHPRFYNVDEATEGGRVTIRGWDQPTEHLRWRRLWARGEDGRMGWGVPIPEGLGPGDTFRGRNTWYWTNRAEQEFTVVEEWHPVDIHAESWWSGPQNFDYYLRMFRPWAEEIRKVNPEVTIIAGWDFGLHHGDWGVWRQLTAPLIDAAPELIDGIAEHHYGVDTRWVPVWYEVIAHYGQVKHGRRIRGYNTECGGRLDPAVHGIDAAPADARERILRDAAEATYELRDMIELAARAPDKVGSRTSHHADRKPGVVEAFRFLRDLRGTLMHTASSDPEVWAVASRRDDALVVMAFNDAAGPRTLAFDIHAPRGATLGAGTVSWLEAGEGGLVTASRPLEADGVSVRLTWDLEARQALKVVLPLTGDPTPARVVRTQHFGGEVLEIVAPGEALEVTVPLPEGPRAEAAWLRLVLDGAQPPGLSVRLNGKELTLPGIGFVTDLPVDPADVQARNTVEIRNAEDAPGRFRIPSVSLLVDRGGGERP